LIPERRVFHVLLAAALMFVACNVFAQDRNLLPKYGPLPKLDWQEASDSVFIAGMDKDYHGDRSKASMDMAGRGWQHLQQGDLDDAMRRFNQAWLLNNSNGTALWGMAQSRRARVNSMTLLSSLPKPKRALGASSTFQWTMRRRLERLALRKAMTRC